ncbi:hypothetical protein GCM10010191_08260 [Actinomadura vinacea]|uniref:SDR family oxidoreductase n=1 Tax=Actinomadura vinacea TaxID=115336 RepID=A0ABN3IGR8_9ACTN
MALHKSRADHPALSASVMDGGLGQDLLRRHGGEPHELVGAALAGPGAGFTAGAVLSVDGGRATMR